MAYIIGIIIGWFLAVISAFYNDLTMDKMRDWLNKIDLRLSALTSKIDKLLEAQSKEGNNDRD